MYPQGELRTFLNKFTQQMLANVLKSTGARILPVPVDGDGLIVKAGLHRMRTGRYSVYSTSVLSPEDGVKTNVFS